MLQWNGNFLSVNGLLTSFGEPVPPPPAPAIPSDMDFVYCARNFDGTKIVNAVQGSTFGDYLENGTLTVNGSGASCYLSNGLSSSNYLYKDLSEAQLNAIKAESGTYTFFIRMMQTGSYSTCGGIMSTRMNGGYVYMLRCENNQIQFHDRSGHNLGADFMMNVDRVYKLQVSGAYFYGKNLDTDATTAISFGTSRSMGYKMTTFNAGFGIEMYLDRFYGFAGIARATTEEEDTQIKNYLMSQGL